MQFKTLLTCLSLQTRTLFRAVCPPLHHLPVCLLLSVWLLIPAPTQAAPSAVHPDYQPLADLYNDTQGASWTNHANWITDPNPCNWNGIHCNSSNRVTDVNLQNNNLVGSISGTLSNVTFLEKLFLSGNKLSGGIPGSLSSLSHLQYLYLDNNQLTGGIPGNLGALSNLQYLYLNSNKLDGEIPGQLGDLHSLKELFLNDNKLEGAIPGSLSGLTSLQKLFLSNNLLTGNIPGGQLGSLSNLQALYLDNNKLEGTIPGQLGNLSNLQFLYLNSNALTGSIPVELGNLHNLKDLFLNNNKLDSAIPGQLSGLTSLQKLFLSNNLLTGAIPGSLGSLSNLQYLYLDNNRLSEAIPGQLGDLKNLKFLYLNSNQLTGAIPGALGGMTSLEELFLNDNRLISAIPGQLGDLSNLKKLFFSTNQLSGAIPGDLSKLTGLQFLWLDNNQLSGCFPGAFSVFCSNGTNIKLNNNTGLPGGGSAEAFAAFCSSGVGREGFTPIATASPASVCIGGTVSLSVTAGSSYKWSGPNSFNATQQTPSFVANSTASSGVYSVTVGNGGGTCTGTTTVSLTVNTPPTATLSNNGPLTSTNPMVTLTAGGGATYAFSSGASQQGGPSGNTATVTSPGAYQVTVTSSSTGCSATASTQVTGAVSASSCRNGTGVITVVASGTPVKYEWYRNSINSARLTENPAQVRGTSTASLTLVNQQVTADYYVRVTDQNGSAVVYGPFKMTVNLSCNIYARVGTEEVELRISLLGNPIQSDQLRATVSGAAGKLLNIQLLDLSGKPIHQQQWQQAESNQAVEWNLSGQASGVYLLQANTEADSDSPAQRQSLKVIKP